ncbi:MAG: helix-turn-helix domain-containing protein [Mogibacterium sp.]|nr:helix-turn-helix domain-containing protein [Mogibacterium sp.]
MTRAYDEILLERASGTLGRMLDFAVHSLRQDPAVMLQLFVSCGLASFFEQGDVSVTAGMSGIELAYETLDRSGLAYERAMPRHTASLSPEYWCGYALARAQWESCLPFGRIMKSFSVAGLISDYSRKRLEYLDSLPLDIRADERTRKIRENGRNYALEAVPEIVSAVSSAAVSSDTALKAMRMRNGLSQSQLAKASGVPLRTIQQYEQRQKDINRARAEYIIAISAALGCEPSSLLEKKQG